MPAYRSNPHKVVLEPFQQSSCLVKSPETPPDAADPHLTLLMR